MAITMAKTSLARDVAAVACGETLSCLWEGVDRAKLINNECLFPVDLLKYPEAQSGLSLHLKQIAGCLQSTVLTRKVCVEDVPKVDQEETQDSPCSGAHLLDSSTPKQGTPTLQSEKRCYRHFDVRNEASWVTTHTLDQRGNAWHESAETFSDIIRN
uniref:Uncharacterized protein n=1 Tax=Timema bartmani TaxID=61472 RepID=A0A7R9I4C3_9NEOP|nr:unnamed protein product [Timema bartmani]